MDRAENDAYRAAEDLIFRASYRKRPKSPASAQDRADVVSRALPCSDTSIGPINRGEEERKKQLRWAQL